MPRLYLRQGASHKLVEKVSLHKDSVSALHSGGHKRVQGEVVQVFGMMLPINMMIRKSLPGVIA
jgi:hypothetical protein